MNRNTHYHIILDFTERIATVNTHGTSHVGGISALFLALALGLFRFPPKRTVANQTHCWTFFSSDYLMSQFVGLRENQELRKS